MPRAGSTAVRRVARSGTGRASSPAPPVLADAEVLVFAKKRTKPDNASASSLSLKATHGIAVLYTAPTSAFKVVYSGFAVKGVSAAFVRRHDVLKHCRAPIKHRDHHEDGELPPFLVDVLWDDGWHVRFGRDAFLPPPVAPEYRARRLRLLPHVPFPCCRVT